MSEIIQENILIPEKLHIGFQNREDSLDGLLSFVSYFKKDGKIAHQQSMYDGYSAWVDKKIPVKEIMNIPRTGFVLSVGVRRSSYHGSGRSLLRIYSPDDFEFEIPVDNFSNLMQYCDMSKRYISGEAVIAFQSGKVILLSTASPEYQRAVEYSDAHFGKTKKVDNRPSDELIVGNYYSPSPASSKMVNRDREFYAYMGEKSFSHLHLVKDAIDIQAKTLNLNTWDTIENGKIITNEIVCKKQPVYLNISQSVRNMNFSKDKNFIGQLIDISLSQKKMLQHKSPIFENSYYSYNSRCDKEAKHRVETFKSLENEFGFDLDFNPKSLKYIPIAQDLESYSKYLHIQATQLSLTLLNSKGKLIFVNCKFFNGFRKSTNLAPYDAVNFTILNGEKDSPNALNFIFDLNEAINLQDVKSILHESIKAPSQFIQDKDHTEQIIEKMESMSLDSASNFYAYTYGSRRNESVSTSINGFLNLFHPDYLGKMLNSKFNFGEPCTVKIHEKTTDTDWDIIFKD